MDINTWLQYKYQTHNAIAQELIQEEIDQQTRHREQVHFRCVAKQRLHTAVFWGLPTLFLLINYLRTDSLDRTFGGVIPILLLAAVWLVRVCRVSSKAASRYLVRDAVKAPEVPFSQLVSEDLQERTGPAGSKAIHLLVCLAVMLGSLAVPVTDRLTEIRVDGLIFKSRDDGCILVDCEPGFRTAQVVIPEQVQGEPVTAIASGAFMNVRSIVSVHIPDSVTSIGAEAFSGCTGLESIQIPESVTEIRGNCFENCTGLKQVDFHDGITAIHGYAFTGCSSLKTVTLPRGITEVRAYCFENCTSLQTVWIPEGVVRIAAHAFMGCKALTSVTVPSTVREIGSSAFRQCPMLKAIEIPAEAVVDERSFKESPTEVSLFWFTALQKAAIDHEIENRVPTVLYFIYDAAKGPDAVRFFDENNTVLLVDDARYAGKLSEDILLQPLEDNAALMDYLKLARDQGAKSVEYALYSQVATDVKGRDWFVSYTFSIDAMLDWAKSLLTEA